MSCCVRLAVFFAISLTFFCWFIKLQFGEKLYFVAKEKSKLYFAPLPCVIYLLKNLFKDLCCTFKYMQAHKTTTQLGYCRAYWKLEEILMFKLQICEHKGANVRDNQNANMWGQKSAREPHHLPLVHIRHASCLPCLTLLNCTLQSDLAFDHQVNLS